MAEEDDVDVQSILARLNAAANDDDDDASTPQLDDSEKPDTPLSPSINETLAALNIMEGPNRTASPPKRDPAEIYSVSDPAKEAREQKKQDILSDLANNVALSPAIMSEPDKYLSLLESQPLRAMFDSVRAIYTNNSSQIVEKQKLILEKVAKTKERSQSCLSFYLQKNMTFVKQKQDETEKKVQEVKAVDQEAQKAKHYLLMLIKRLEDLEGKLDHMIAIKNQNKLPSPKPAEGSPEKMDKSPTKKAPEPTTEESKS